MKILPILILIFLLAPVFVFAAITDYCAWDSPGFDASGYQPCSDMCFRDYCISRTLGYHDGPCGELFDYGDFCPVKMCCAVIKVTRWLYFIASGLGLIVIVWGGLMYMTAGGEEAKASKAKKILLYGLIGVMIIFASGYILGTVISFLY